MKKTLLRPLAAFCLAPAVPVLIAGLLVLATGSQDEFAQVLLVSAALAYLAALALGVPVYFFLERRGLRQATPFLAGGAIIGLAAEFLFVVAPVLLLKSPEHTITITPAAALGFSALAAVSGTVAAWAFWLIAIKTAEAG